MERIATTVIDLPLHNLERIFPPLLLLILLTGCSYTSAEKLSQLRLDEGTYAVYWENKKTGFHCQMKGIFDHESALDLAERKRAQRPENKYWVKRVR